MAERQGILDALSDYYQGFASIPGSVMDYIGSTDSATMAEDASQYVSDSASALAKQFKEDPVNMLLDMAPIVGEVRAFMDAEDLREAADQAEAQGNLEQAAKLRQEASVTMTGAIPLLGMAARAGKKVGTAGMQMRNDGKPILPSDRVSPDSIAAPDQDMMLAKRLIDGGFLNIESSGNPSAVKAAITKYRKAMKESTKFRKREELAAENDFRTIFDPKDIGPRRLVSPETLLGKVGIAIQGDMSNLGILRQASGIDAGDTEVQAGNKYSQEREGSGYGWQSMINTAQGVQNKARRVQQKAMKDLGLNESDATPVGLYVNMGRDATNFSTPIAEAMLKQTLAMRPNKADIAEFDKELRNKTVVKNKKRVKLFPDWVGLEHPDAMDQLMGRGKYTNTGAKRTAFATTMDMAKFRDKGFANYNDILNATEDPDLAFSPYMGGGLSMYQMSLGDAVFDPKSHRSYTGKMPGNYIGGFGGQIPFEILFPDAFATEKARVNKAGVAMPDRQAIGAVLAKGDAFQLYDDKTVQGILDYIDRYGLK